MTAILDPSGNPVLDATEAPVQEAPVTEEAVAETATPDETPELDPRIVELKNQCAQIVQDCEYGYIVAINKEGGITFQECGAQQGFIQLLGLHKFAEARLDIMADVNLQYGPALLATQQNQVIEMLKVLLNMQTNASKSQILGAMKK